MMNLGDAPVCLVPEDALNALVRRYVDEVATYIDRIEGTGSFVTYDSITAASRVGSKYAYFKKIFKYGADARDRVFSFVWVSCALRFCNGDIKVEELKFLLGSSFSDYRKSTYRNVRKGLWLILFCLYKEKAVLLPLSFRMYSVPFKDPKDQFGYEFYPELMRFCKSAINGSDERFWGSTPGTHRTMIASFGAKISWAIGAVRPEDITLSSLVGLYENFAYGEIEGISHMPIFHFGRYLCEKFKGRVEFSYSQLLTEIESVKEKRAGVVRRNRSGELGRRRSEVKSLSDVSGEDKVIGFVRDRYREVILADYSPGRLIETLSESPRVSGLLEAAMLWDSIQRQYCDEKAYEVDNSRQYGLSRLNLFLFEYLPEVYLEDGEVFNIYPKDLAAWMISRVYVRGDGVLSFKSFCEVIANDNRDGGYRYLIDVRKFFDWIVSRSSCLIGCDGFSNYLREISLPKPNRRSETNKRAFPTSYYIISLVYCYKLVELMQILNDCVINAGKVVSDFDFSVEAAKAFGWDNKFKAGGEEFEIVEIPKGLFPVWRIPFRRKRNCDLIAPHYLNHIFTALDTGLRHQAVQWLAIDFDKYVGSIDSCRVLEVIEVSSDKVREARFKVIASGKLVEALRYQKKLRGLVFSDAFSLEIPYQNRERSKWGTFLPLFSFDVESGLPYSDSTYTSAYKNFLVHFQSFLKFHGKECHFFELKPAGFEFGEEVVESKVKLRSFEGNVYCPISVKTDMTPHHTRASVVKTWRKLVSDKDISLLKTGQSVSTINYYDALIDEEREELRGAAESVVERIWRGEPIKPHLPNSNFRKAVERDAAGAMSAFGCVSMCIAGLESCIDGVERIRRNNYAGLSYHATHICVMNNVCPPEIVAAGCANRCGFCPYGVRGVDHLEAIEVKIYVLGQEIIELHEHADSLESSGEAQAELEKLDEHLSLTVQEALSWSHSRDVLVGFMEGELSDKDNYLSYSPEIARKALREIKFKTDSSEYLISRLAQVNSFPGLQSDSVKATFKRLHAKLISGSARSHLLGGRNPDDPSSLGVSQIYSLINSIAKTTGKTIGDLAQEITLASRNDIDIKMVAWD